MFNDDVSKIEVKSGLTKNLQHVFLACFEWAATGEGVTEQAQIVFGPKFLDLKDEDSEEESIKEQLDIGFDDFPYTDLIPLAIEETSEIEGRKFSYLAVNPQFKLKFLELFGGSQWSNFWRIVVDEKSCIDLISKMHFNLF